MESHDNGRKCLNNTFTTKLTKMLISIKISNRLLERLFTIFINGNLDLTKCNALFIDPSKAYDSLQHDLLFDKLNVYRFSFKSIKLISSSLS